MLDIGLPLWSAAGECRALALDRLVGFYSFAWLHYWPRGAEGVRDSISEAAAVGSSPSEGGDDDGIKQSVSLSSLEACNATFDAVYAEQVGPRFLSLKNVSSLPFAQAEQHYMDFTGSSIYLNRQIKEYNDILKNGVFGNPHSMSVTSELSTQYVVEMRAKLFEFFSADPEVYEVIFSRSATGSLHLLGEAFPFSKNGSYAYTVSNHNSVLGIRAFAAEKGARIGAVTEEEVEAWLDGDDDSMFKGTVLETGDNDNGEKTYSLFAYPKKDNYAGVLYPDEWIEKVQNKSTKNHEWMVLLDTAAYAPTYRLNLTKISPDFVVISFYKVFGLPTGVGALIMRKESEEKLRRTYWGGSSVFTATSALPWKIRFENAAKWEDGTLPFLDIVSLKPGFDAMEYLGGIDSVEKYVTCLGTQMSTTLKSLKHSNGSPMLRLYGKHYDSPESTGGPVQSGTIANFQILKPSGELFSYRTAARVLSEAGFNVRDGCMCNPGACYAAVGVKDTEVRDKAIAADGDYSDWEWITVERNGTLVTLPLGSIRVSLGWMSRIADIEAFVNFLEERYKDTEIDPQPEGAGPVNGRGSDWFIC